MAAVLAGDYQHAQHSLPAWCLGLVRVLQSALRQWHLFAQAQEVHRDQFRLTAEPPALTSTTFAPQSWLEKSSQTQLHCSRGTTQARICGPCFCSLVVLCFLQHRCVLTHTREDVSREFIQIIRGIVWELQIPEKTSCYPPMPHYPNSRCCFRQPI